MKKIDRNMLDSDHVGRLLLIFTIPAFFAMAVHTLYNIVDTIFIGRYVGPMGIAGLSLVFPIQMLSIGIGHMAGMGGASLISRSLGAKKKALAQLTLGNSITITGILSLIVTVGGLANVRFWCRLLGASDNTLIYTSDYLSIILIGMVFMTFGMTLSILIRASGNAKVPMIGMIIGAGLNIILDAIFIIPLGMGIKGAAIATVISNIVSVIYFMLYYFLARREISEAGSPFKRVIAFMIYFLLDRPDLKFKLTDLKPDWKIIGEIFAIGASSLGMTLAGSLSAIVINRTVVSYGGDMAMSAFGIVNRVMMFAIMPAIVAGQGLQPVVGFNYGAERYDRVLRGIKICITGTTLVSFTVFLSVLFNPEIFVRIFTTDAELIDLASYAVVRVFAATYLTGFIHVGATVFQSLGKAIQAFLSTVTRSVMFLLPTILVLPKFLGLDGVWWAFPISDLMTFLLVLGMLVPVWLDMRRLHSAQILEMKKRRRSSQEGSGYICGSSVN
jgi:Na+-driven multidrug efflux pump